MDRSLHRDKNKEYSLDEVTKVTDMKARLTSVGYSADDKISTRSRHFLTPQHRFRFRDPPWPSSLKMVRAAGFLVSCSLAYWSDVSSGDFFCFSLPFRFFACIVNLWVKHTYGYLRFGLPVPPPPPTHTPFPCTHTYAYTHMRARAHTHARTHARSHARTHAHYNINITFITISFYVSLVVYKIDVADAIYVILGPY